MEDHSYYVYLGWAVVSLAVGLAAYWRFTTARKNGLRLPPGPWQLPVIGSLHHLARKLPHHALRDLAQRHGPVMLLRLGEVPTLVVSSPDAAREVLKTHDLAFASRPLSATMRVLMSDGRNMGFAPYGAYWRNLRKIAVTELLTVRRVRSFSVIREREVGAMLRHIESAAGRPVDMRARLSAAVSATTFCAIMGEGDRGNHREMFLRELDTLIGLTTGFHPVDMWPSLWLATRLSSTLLRRAEENHARLFRIIKAIIQEHLSRDKEEETKDMLDVLLKIHKGGGVDMPAVEALIFDLFAAGSETSTTTLEWAMTELIKNPTAMKKATAEVRQAFESGGTVVEERLSQLPYLHLVIQETLRLHPPAPLLLPRECRESCKVLGFDVPKGTQVLVNVWALARDKKCWPDAAEEFRPERFEAADAVDFRGTDFEFLPFGAGRRMCPGMSFGLANVELPLASLLLHFDWEAPNISELDMTEVFGVTVRRKASLVLRPFLHVPIHPTSV